MTAPPGTGGSTHGVPRQPRHASRGGVLSANLIANFTGRAWSILAVWLFMPLYVRYLGADAFGLVGLYSAVQSFIMIADTGLSPAVSREMARLSVKPGSGAEIRNLIRTLEVTLLATVLVLGALLTL